MWNKIINPNNGKKININSKLGKYILKSYIKQLGGAATSPYNNYSPHPKRLFGRILVEMTKLKVHKNLYVACHGGSLEPSKLTFKLPNNIAVIHITRHNCSSACFVSDDINLRNQLNNTFWLITNKSTEKLSYFNNCHLYLPNSHIPNQQLDWDWGQKEVDKSFGIYELGKKTEHVEDNIWEEQSFPPPRLPLYDPQNIDSNMPIIYTKRNKLDSLQYKSYYDFNDGEDYLDTPNRSFNFDFTGNEKSRCTMENLITYISGKTPPGDLRIIFINNCSPVMDRMNCSDSAYLRNVDRLRQDYYEISQNKFTEYHAFAIENIRETVSKLGRNTLQGEGFGIMVPDDQYGCNVDDPSDICVTDCEYSNLCSKFSSKICNIYPKCENKFGIKVNCKKPCK